MLDTQNIKVLNYATSAVAVSTRERGVLLAPAEQGVPTFEFFTMQEVLYINSRSNCFRSGMLEFEEDVQEEVYAQLSIPDWREKCIFERDIDPMLLHPSMEQLQRIVASTDVQLIERFRGHLVRLMRSGGNVQVKVQRIIEVRHQELLQGRMKSGITLTPQTRGEATPNAEVEDLRREVEAMKELLAQKAQANAPKQEAEAEKAEAAPEKEKPAKPAARRKSTAPAKTAKA